MELGTGTETVPGPGIFAFPGVGLTLELSRFSPDPIPLYGPVASSLSSPPNLCWS